jgi:hypothetical protein
LACPCLPTTPAAGNPVAAAPVVNPAYAVCMRAYSAPNLPYLFTYQKHPDLNIPNTTNSLDGCFAYLKELVKVHKGSKKSLKRKIIEEILWK